MPKIGLEDSRIGSESLLEGMGRNSLRTARGGEASQMETWGGIVNLIKMVEIITE